MTALAQEFELQGHRGARGLAPENTLAGFAVALGIGVSALELDVGVSRDGIVMVTHNRKLEPAITRNGDGDWLEATGPTILSLSAGELQTYDVGRIEPGSDYAKHHPAQEPVDGARMPTLRQVFELIQRSGNEHVRLNIESKLDPAKPHQTVDPETFATSILDVAREFDMLNRIIIQSFDWRVLQHVQRLAAVVATAYLTAQQPWRDNLSPEWNAGFDIDDYNGSIPRMIKAAGGKIWSPFQPEINETLIGEAHGLDIAVIVWTVNLPARMNTLIDWGVDGIITDYPNRLLSVMEERGMKTPAPTPVKP